LRGEDGKNSKVKTGTAKKVKTGALSLQGSFPEHTKLFYRYGYQQQKYGKIKQVKC